MEDLHIKICNNLLPKYPHLEIVADLLDAYIMEYCKLTNGSIPKGSNLRYAKKLAAINLIKFKRSIKQKTKAGFVYVIVNPIWPTKAKIGLSVDPLERLKTFNTADPYRAYKLYSWGLFFQVKEAESLFHRYFAENIDHEWVDLETYKLSDIAAVIQKHSNTY